ncbi:MAG: hypothetical protein Q9165_001304 [Trypethelium subeluteriae]
MVSNFIAYEAFTYIAPHDTNVRLRSLKSLNVSDTFGIGRLNALEVPSGRFNNLSIAQSSNIKGDITGLLTGLSFEDATSRSDAEGACINSNATMQSLDELDQSIVRLTNVPGYRLSLDKHIASAQFEMQRMTYEVAAQHSTNIPADQFYSISAAVSLNAYRITYIPLIFLPGCLSITSAGIIVCALIQYAWNLRKLVLYRGLDTLRLLVDSAVGFQESALALAKMEMMSGTQLTEWAEKFRVSYSKTVEGGERRVRLLQPSA